MVCLAICVLWRTLR